MNSLNTIGLLLAFSLLPAFSITVAEGSEEQEVRKAADGFYDALRAMLAGDVKPMEEVWSHADDVSYMGPGGGMYTGWADVFASWQAQANMNLGGKVAVSDMHVIVGNDIAIVQNNENGSDSTVDGKILPPFTLRATNVFRKEDGEWKMISHHTDLFPGTKQQSNEKKVMKKTLSAEQESIIQQFQSHIDAEIRGDLDTTLATMTPDPHLNNIPTMIGGLGQDGVREFYASLIPFNKFFPPDLEMIPVSQTIDQNQLVDEIIFKFTHTTEVGWMLPNIPPTGKRVEIPLVVIVGFEDGKVTHEHIYWDQASVLVQIGLLDPKGLPVHGVETAHRMEEIRKRVNSK